MNIHYDVLAFITIWCALLTLHLGLWLVRTAVITHYYLWVQKHEKDIWTDEMKWTDLVRVWRRREWRQSGLKVRWVDMGPWPEFYRWERTEKKFLRGRLTLPWWEREEVYARELRPGQSPDTFQDHWQVGDNRRYLITSVEWLGRRSWTPIMKTLWYGGLAIVGAFVLSVVINVTTGWLATRSIVPTQIAAPTQVAAPTSAALPTATPAPEVEVIDGGDSIVIDLNEQAPASALLEWINSLPGPNLPALPPELEAWINSLLWPEIAAFEMPEGMDGFVIVARKGDGFELVRLDDYGNPVGGPLALKEVKEFTLHARELKWGVRFSDKFRVTNESQGHIDVYVAESGEPSMATGYHLYNFRWWHIAVLIIVIIIGGVVYRRIYN